MLVLLSESLGQCELGRNTIRKHVSAPILKIHPRSGADAARGHMHPQESRPSDWRKGYTPGWPFCRSSIPLFLVLPSPQVFFSRAWIRETPQSARQHRLLGVSRRKGQLPA